MKNTDKHLHIVAFATPFPPRYGGVIDVFFKLKALHREKVKVHLHAFTYDNHPPREELKPFCETITYYQRKTGWKAACSLMPYIVKSRLNNELLDNLMKDNYPIIFEGLHTCGYLTHPKLKDRVKIYRESNIEHHYYYHLFKSTKSVFKKVYYLTEAFKLNLYQDKLKHADAMLAVSLKDAQYLQKKYPDNHSVHLPSFHENDELTILEGAGDYALYHGNMTVAENYLAAEYLIKNVFSKAPIPFVIAGFNPPQRLYDLAKEWKNIRIIKNPDDATMSKLIREAQVHTLVTFQATGLKLKLVNTLFKGRHILVNPQMVAGTEASKLCVVGHTSEELLDKLQKLMQTPFDQEVLKDRQELLNSLYSNHQNVRKLLKIVFKQAID